MKLFFFTFLCLTSSICYSQVNFEPGYIIDNLENKTSCLIKNKGWKNAPNKFQIKYSSSSPIKSVTIDDNIVEISVGAYKYVKKNVNLDLSHDSDFVAYLSREKAPEFVNQDVFLRVLIQGNASLYEYKTSEFTRFFYSKNTFTKITPLVYKKYLSNNKIKENIEFKTQLISEFSCDGIALSSIQKLNYNFKSLSNYFIKINECKGSNIINLTKKPKRNLFDLSLKAGIQRSSLALFNNGLGFRDFIFDKKYSFRYGIEAEFVLPFNQNKWALILEPTYQSYETTLQSNIGIINVNYRSIEFPLGLRYYLFLNSNSKLFINTAFNYDFELKNSLINFETINDIDVKSRPNLSLGLGIYFLDKFSLEFKYFINREIVGETRAWRTDYNISSILIGYTLF